ncbi:hypothetical protein F2P56_022273 [Juglans regia]|uniref:Mitochondrial protein n=2 Tax=Juglans regia TaxID=51240 RepID=A0A833TZD0_JUGRE|nr:uncharacterized mitochondrial protein AtMg00810-like [Juglans regia]KAF5458226.1 hypothetical protein F2P56_022273 [Juglans regia]
MVLSQTCYVSDLLEHASIGSCKSISTPLPSKGRTEPSSNEPYNDPTHKRNLVGGLQYLTCTRPNLSYRVNYACQFMHAPTIENFKLVKRILRYVHGTADYGLQILSSNTLDVYAFSDVDWAGCPTTRHSTTDFCTFLGSNCISWNTKKQPTVARSSTEA